MTRRAFVAAVGAPALRATRAEVKIASLPERSVQPEVVIARDGRPHVVYLSGDPGHSDLYYATGPSASELRRGVRVNSIPGSAIASGTIRGAHLSLAADGRPHVAWNGHGQAQPAPPLPSGADSKTAKHRSPMLYSRLDASGSSFGPQRNLLTRSYALDGGGSIAAGARNQVYVGWHAHLGEGPEGEEGRRVWLARSADGGESFSQEEIIFGKTEGACACCGLRLFAASDGSIYCVYRSAFKTIHRDLYLLRSSDQGRTFAGRKIHEWKIGACPMSSMHFVENGGRIWTAWETAGQVWFARADEVAAPISAPGKANHRKHPRLAVDEAGRMLLTWNSVPGWAKSGKLGWALYGPAGRFETSGGGEAIPVWSFATPVAGRDRFTILI